MGAGGNDHGRISVPHSRVNGVELYYESHGQGEPLLLVHGFSGTGRSHWSHQIPVLSQHYRLIVPDLRAHGRSKPVRIPPRYWEVAASDLAALLRALGIQQAHVCGFSMGSVIAQLVAIHDPALVRSLILISTTSHVSNDGQGLVAFFDSLSRPDEIDPDWRKALVAEHGEPDWRVLLQEYGRVALRRVQTNGDLTRSLLHHITCPTLIVQGRWDKMNPPALADVVHEGIVKSELVTFDCGHFVQMTMAEEFNRAALAFLNGADG